MKARDRYFVEAVSCVLDGESYRVANLGVGGFFAACAHPPELGQVLVMDLHLPDRGSFRVIAEVSWINRSGRGRVDELPPGFGVRFVRLGRRDRETIEDLLKFADPVLGDPPSKRGE